MPLALPISEEHSKINFLHYLFISYQLYPPLMQDRGVAAKRALKKTPSRAELPELKWGA